MFINYAKPYLFPLLTILLLVATSEERCLMNHSFCNKKFKKNDSNRGKINESVFTDIKRMARNDKSVNSVAYRKQRINSSVNATSTNHYFTRPKSNLASNAIDSTSASSTTKVASKKEGVLQKPYKSNRELKTAFNLKQDFIKNRKPHHSKRKIDKAIKSKRHRNIRLRRQRLRSYSPYNLSGRHVLKSLTNTITKSSIVSKIKDNQAILFKRKNEMPKKEIRKVSSINNGDFNIKHWRKPARYHLQTRNKKSRDLKVLNTTKGLNGFHSEADLVTEIIWYLNPLRYEIFHPNTKAKDLKESTDLQFHTNFESPKKMIYFTPSTFQFAYDNNQQNGTIKLIKGYNDSKYNINQIYTNAKRPGILQNRLFSKNGTEQEYRKINDKVFPIKPNKISILKHAPTADMTSVNRYPNFYNKAPNKNSFLFSPNTLPEISKYMSSGDQVNNKKEINTFETVSNFQNNQPLLGKKIQNSIKNAQASVMSKQTKTNKKYNIITPKVIDKYINPQRTNIGQNAFRKLINQNKKLDDLKPGHRLPRQGLKGFKFIHSIDTQNINFSRKGNVDGINLDKIKTLLLTLKRVLDDSKAKAGTQLYKTLEYSSEINYTERPEEYGRTFHVYLKPVFKAELPGKLTLVEDVNLVTSSKEQSNVTDTIDVKGNTFVTSPETVPILKWLFAILGLAFISFLTVAIYLVALKHKSMQNLGIECSMLKKDQEYRWPFNTNAAMFENQKCEQEIYDRMIEDNRNLKSHLSNVLGNLQFTPEEYAERRYLLRQHQKKLSDAMTRIIK